MASLKVRAIVLGGVNIKEKDKLVNIFTLENGKMTVSMKGVRGDKAKLKSAKEMFCFGDFVVEQGKFLNVVTSVDIIDNFFNISSDIDKYYEACAIIDIVNKIVVESNPQIFIEVLKALKTLAYDDVKKYIVIDKFLLSLFDILGYSFVVDKCSACGAKLSMSYFDLATGSMVCPLCKTYSSVKISPVCFATFNILNNTEYEKLSTVSFSGMGEVQAFNLLSQNYEWRTGFKLLNII